MACGDDHRGRAQAVVTRSRPGLAQDRVADRRHQRASRAAARPYLPRLQRPGAITPARRGPQWRRQDGQEIATALNGEGFVAARGCTFKGENVWLLRKRWGIATV